MKTIKRWMLWFGIRVLRRKYIYLVEEELGTQIARFHYVDDGWDGQPFGRAKWKYRGKKYRVMARSNGRWQDLETGYFRGDWRFVTAKKPLEFNVKAKRSMLRVSS